MSTTFVSVSRMPLSPHMSKFCMSVVMLRLLRCKPASHRSHRDSVSVIRLMIVGTVVMRFSTAHRGRCAVGECLGVDYTCNNTDRDS